MRNPIVERELVGALRGHWGMTVQLLPALGCSALVLFRWPADGQADIGGARSQEAFRLFGYGLLLTLMLLAPAFPATSLVRERIRGTLALLLQSPMRRGSIYFGKMFGILAFAFLPLLASLPAAAACCVMGGVSVRDQVLPLYGTLALALLQFTALGLCVSSRAGSVESALRTTYGLVLLLVLGTLAPYSVLQGSTLGPVVKAAAWLRSLSPLPAVTEILGHAGLGSQGLAPATGEPVRYAIFSLLSSLLFMAATILRLTSRMFDRSRDAGQATDDLSSRMRWRRRLFFLVDPNRRSQPIGDLVNPLFVKEFRTRRFGRSHWLVRLVAACSIGSLALALLSSAAAVDWGTRTICGLIVLFQGALIVLLTPGLAAGLVSGEVESGSWSLLRMTPLSANRILLGKLLSVIWVLALILVATLPGYAVLIYAQPSLLQPVAQVLFSLLLTGLFALALSAAVGSLLRRSAPATTAAYAAIVVVYAAPLVVWSGRDAFFAEGFVERVLTASPLATALAVMEVPGFARYHLAPTAWWVTAAMTIGCLAILRARMWRLNRPD